MACLSGSVAAVAAEQVKPLLAVLREVGCVSAMAVECP